MKTLLFNPVFLILLSAVVLNILFFLNVKINSAVNSYLFSILLHGILFFGITFKPTVGEIVEEYKLVQLVDIKEIAESQIEKSEGEIKVVKENKKTIVPPPEKKDEVSMYLPFFQVLKLPEFLLRVKPAYPAKALADGKEAVVLVEIYISPEGEVKKVVVIKSGGDDFDAAVIGAIYKSKFRPAVSKEGKPVGVRVRIPYHFTLE